MQLAGSLTRSSGSLLLQYELRGKLAQILLPEPAAAPSRRPDLWQSTCFEFFVAVKDSPHYWEVNLSPSGDWNVYAFAGYRAGMQEEPAFAALPFAVRRSPEGVQLAIAFALETIVSADQPVSLAVSAVIKDRNGRSSYWALTHCGPKPDFHLREGFVLTLPGHS
jgi:hypothetical protein